MAPSSVASLQASLWADLLPLRIGLHVGVVATAVTMIYMDAMHGYVEDFGRVWDYHPTIMTAAWMLFMAQGLVTSIGFRHLTGEKRVAAIWRHALWTGPGNLLLVAGFYQIYKFKESNFLGHFDTLHSWMGLGTLVLSLGSQLGGAISFRKLGILDCLPPASRPYIKAIHRNVGFVAFLAAAATMEVALCYPVMKAKKYIYAGIIQGGILGAALMIMMLSWVMMPPAGDGKTVSKEEPQESKKAL